MGVVRLKQREEGIQWRAGVLAAQPWTRKFRILKNVKKPSQRTVKVPWVLQTRSKSSIQILFQRENVPQVAKKQRRQHTKKQTLSCGNFGFIELDKCLGVSDENLHHGFYNQKETLDLVPGSVLHPHSKIKRLSPFFRSNFKQLLLQNQHVFSLKIGFEKTTSSSCAYLLFCVKTVQPNPMNAHKPKLPLLPFETVFFSNSCLLWNCNALSVCDYLQ